MSQKALTITELNEQVSNMFKMSYQKSISIIGEASNMKISRSHLYMKLKDKSAMVNIVCWNFAEKHTEAIINNGDKIIIIGRVSFYKKTGNYQVIASSFQHIGTGDLHSKYLKLKQKLTHLGYFKKDKKKELPKELNNIGVITAKSGAALKDFLYVLDKKKYVGTIYFKNCNVQGINCPKSVSESIEILDKKNLDVIIIMRGGGSYEDLFGFSSKQVANSIYKAKTCIISAIGHEVDFMLSDYVADIRAPTPSIAGEIVATHQWNYHNLKKYEKMLSASREKIRNKLYKLREKLADLFIKLEKLNVQHTQSINHCTMTHKNQVITDVNDLRKLAKLRGKKLKIQLQNGYVLVSAKALNIYNNE